MADKKVDNRFPNLGKINPQNPWEMNKPLSMQPEVMLKVSKGMSWAIAVLSKNIVPVVFIA